MKQIALIPIAALGMGMAINTHAQDATGGYGPDSTYNRSFNTTDTFTFNGRVTAVKNVTPLPGMAQATALTVEQSGGEIFNVHLGPSWFVSRMPYKIKLGDNVIIQGSRSNINGKKLIFAETVSKGKQTVAFRSKSGWGRWNAVEPNLPVPENPTHTGTVRGISSANYGGVNYDVYNIETGAGSVRILGAPSWYGRYQPRMLQVGNNVSVYGAMRLMAVGGNVFVADGFATGGTYFITNPW